MAALTFLPLAANAAAPAAPTLNSAVAGNARVTLNWTLVSGASTYKIRYGTVSGTYNKTVNVSNISNYTVTGLTNGTKYYFVVAGLDSSGIIGVNSNEKNATPTLPPTAPTLNSATAGNGQVTLAWSSVSTATSYSVRYGTSSGVYGPSTSLGNVTSYTVSGLTNGTTYYFVVTATNAGGTSPNSNEKNATPQVPAPTAPTLNTATAGNAQAALSWSAVSGATSYSIKYGTATGNYTLTANPGSATSFTVTGLTNGTTYYFVVTATNAGGTSPNSNEKSALPTATTGNGPTAQWPLNETSGTVVTDSSGNGNTGTNVGATVGQPGQVSLSYLFNGTNNYVNLGTNSSLNIAANEAFTFAAWVKTTDTYGPIISFRNSVDDGAVIDIAVGTDGPVNSAGKVMALVHEDFGGGNYVHVTGGTVNDGQWHHVAITRNTTGTMELFLDGFSQGSQTSTGADGAITTNIRALASELRWVQDNVMPGDQRYLSGQIDEARFYKRQLTLTEIQQLAVNSNPAPTAPILNTATAGNGQVALSWGAVSGATSYSIKYGTATGNYTLTANPASATSFTVTGLTNGTTYYFVITATNAGGTSVNSNEKNAAPQVAAPSAPTLNTATAGNAQAALSWSAVSGATSYSIKYGTATGNYTLTANPGSATSFTVTGLTNGTTYYFVVTATNAGGTSPNSNEKSALPTATTGNGPTAQWPLDETSGTVVTDSSGNGNTGTNVGATVGQPGQGSLSYLFNGTNNYVNLGTNSSLNIAANEAFTFATWVKTTDAYGSLLSFRNNTDGGVVLDIAVGYNGVTNSAGKIMTLVREDYGGGNYSQVVGGSLNNGQWHHVALTRNTTGTVELFLDGVSQGSQASTGADGAITTNIRALATELRWVQESYGTGDLQYLSGQIDEVRFYKSQLTLAEIQQLAVNSNPAPTAPILNTATAGNGQVALSWSAVSGATSYSIKYGTATGNYTLTANPGSATSFTVTGLTNGTTYYFVVTATNAGGTSSNSNEKSVLPTAITGSGLTAQWPLDETSGTVVTDSSGNGNAGTNVGATVGQPGQVSLSYLFNGTNNYVNLGTSSALNIGANEAFTFATWVKTADSYGPILSFRDSVEDGAVIDIVVGYDGPITSAGKIMGLVRETAASSYAEVIGGVMNNGQWHHVALTRNTTGKIELFLDGVSQGTHTSIYADGAITANMRALGSERRWVQVSSGSVDQQYLSGQIDEVRFYKSQLTLAEIQQLAVNSNPVPTAPTLNTTTAGNGQVALSWSAVSGATSYSIKYGTATGNYTMTANPGSATSFTVTGLTNGTTYYFVVTATNAGGTSPNSNEKNATPQIPAPIAPTLINATAGNALVTLGWNVVSGATSYSIKYGTSSGVYGAPINVGNVTGYNVTGLTNGTLYYFVVTATNAGGTSANSNEQSATPMVTATLYVKNVDYNANGQTTKIEYGNGMVTTYTYNSLTLRLTRILTVDAQVQKLQDLNYTYDPAGNVLTIVDSVNTASQNFQYDELNRLVQANGTSYGNKNYVYDEIGNIVQKDGLIYGYGEGSGGPHAVTSLSNGTTFSYDANGNMIQKVEPGNITTQYSYDVENRLNRVDKNGANIALYEYDGDGGRTKVTMDGVVTTYVGSLYEETASRKTSYVFLGDTRVASISNGQTLYYHTDHLGSANVLTDSSGVKKELMEYEPYGQFSRHEKYGSSEEVAWFYFTGKKLDEESGLFFYGARYYDPSLGRFLTPDTIVQRPSNPQTFNRYTYCNNNPINFVDSDGYSWFSKLFKAVGQFFTNLVEHPVQTILAVATVAVGVVTGNPFLIASGAMQLANIGTSSWQGGGWNTFHQVARYASTALAVAGAFYSPVGAPSAELGYSAAGEYVGTVDLGTIVVTKSQEAINAVKLVQLGNMASLGSAAAQAGIMILQGASNFAAGFGDAVTFGGTNFIRESLGYNNVVDRTGGLYKFGGGAGIASSLALGGAGALNAGARTVLYSGEGALAAANAGKGAGMTILDTFGGRALNVIESRGIKLPQMVWDAASGVFSANAKGTVQIYLRNTRITSVYNRIERPVLDLFNNTIRVFK